MRKLLILCFFLPLIVWGQMVSPLEEGEFFGFSPNVEVEASFKDGFLVFRKFQPLDKVSRVGLKLRCHSGGISSENRLRVLSNGNFAGICEVIHGQSVGTMIDAANNTNLDARGVFPHLRINSQHSLAGELSVTLIPASWRTQVDQLRRQGSLSSTYAFFNSGKAHPFSDGGVSSPVSEARGEPDGGLNRPGSGAGEDREKRQDLERVVALFKSAPSDLGWKSHLDRVIQSELRQWFSPVLVLDEVPTPTYPAALSLKQESWETNKEFEDRVEKARTERRQTIDRLQAEYKSNVDERNRRVAELNKQQQERQARLPQKRRELIQLGISILNPAVSLVDPALDQQSGALTVAAQVDGLGRQTFAFKDTLQAFRKSVLTEPKSMKAKPEFQVSDAGEITLQGITVEAGGISARGFPSAGITPSVQLATVNLPQSTAPALVQQSAITVDRNQVEQILYREEND
ncbi:MAG: hypothetical protein EBV34_12925, partial [Betaproteobacteria bacterium]|nr:hypothetical protein [Betaproteobacteria bacterium]